MKEITKKISESTEISGGQLDRDQCKILGVKIIGTESLNGRIYPMDVLTSAKSLYEGVRVYFDHIGTDTSSHSITTLFGYLEGVRAVDDGLYGDLVYNPKHLYAEQILYQIEHASDKLGLSPHHECLCKKSGDKTMISKIVAVYSVDIVDRPATTGGMFESETDMKGKEMNWNEVTLEDLMTNRPDIVKAIQTNVAEAIMKNEQLLNPDAAFDEPLTELDQKDEDDI